MNDTALAERWHAGELSADIGSALGVSASDVRARARDLGLPRRDSSAFRSKRRARKVHRPWNREGEVGYHPTPPVPQKTFVGDLARVAFADRQKHQCAWPVGEPGNEFPSFGCCGIQVREKGAKYCETHHERAYVQIDPNGRWSDRELMKGVTDLGPGVSPLAPRDIRHARGTR